MSWWSEFKTGETGAPSRFECDVPLGRLTWFRVGGAARYFFRPHDAQDLSRLVRRARDVETGSIWNALGEAVAGPLAGRALEPAPQSRVFRFAAPEGGLKLSGP